MAGRTVTMLLREWCSGDRAAFDELVPLVYDELHRLAARHLRGERGDHTLRPTDLVSEAYLKLAGSVQPAFNDRVHFFAIAARGMRQILVDHARKRATAKRGRDDKPITFDEAIAPSQRPEELLALDEALCKLGEFDERKAKVIELHYFGGLGQEEIAVVLDISVSTVARDQRVAEMWIHRYLQHSER
jgi:RNA polymerase sigma factor (TIGR02999 family)